jgi:hypothetical protein
MDHILIKAIRWFARILGALLVLFFVGSVIKGLVDPPVHGSGKMTTQEIVLMAGMFAMVLGIIIAWFREGLGGLLVVGGFIYFVAVELIQRKQFDAWFLLAFLAVGVLHLICWRQSKQAG